ncbi:MAG TPA: L-threonylcarbamoyladenylate synthase [Bacteroidota bacterium]|nr:L-threonylcarbamoyladenylate synthase [Bacteroidota bacterium]
MDTFLSLMVDGYHGNESFYFIGSDYWGALHINCVNVAPFFMVHTKILTANNNSDEILQETIDVIRRGGLVAFPTETVYGLGADAMNVEAVQKVFAVKGRPATNPLIVHVASLQAARTFAEEIPLKGEILAEKFWPGPLTLVVRAKATVPRIVTGGLDTVAIRVPNQEFTLRLLERFGGGIVGPSANISGKPSPTLPEHVISDFDGKIDLIIDAGQTKIGVESTVVDVTVDPPVILRFGGITSEAIKDVIGKIDVANSSSELRRRSPGTRYRHYAPIAKVIIVEEGNSEQLDTLIIKYQRSEKRIGVITHSQKLSSKKLNVPQYHLKDKAHYAHDLFKLLRKADDKGIEVLLVESVSEQGLGAAIMDRLKRAAEEQK